MPWRDIFLTLVLFWHLQTPAQSISAPAAPQAPSPSQAPTTEVQVLRAQLEDAKRFQDQILNTVYWALGTLAAVTVALTGFGWLANFRVYERDKATLERELQTATADARRALEKESAEAIANLGAELKKTLSEGLDAAEARTKVSVKAVADAARAQHGTLSAEVLELKYNALLAEHDRETHSRSRLQDSINLLDMATELSFNMIHLPDSLDRVSKNVERIVHDQAENPKATLDAFLLTQVFASLERIKGKEAVVAATIAARAKLLRTG